MRNAFYILILLLSVSFFGACNDDFDDYSTSPQDVLTFSVDTLRFDTILSTINTPYTTLKVYNKNKKAVRIASIQLKDHATTGFKINVDGITGTHFEDIRISGKDSLYIFIDAKPGETGQNKPTIVRDEIQFITNTVEQIVTVEAYSQDVVIWNGREITADSLIRNDKPYLIFDSLVIRENAIVDIQEGTTFYMHGDANIIVEGTIRINGTSTQPVTIRGDRTDWFFDNVPYDRIPGQWGGIRFRSTSFNNVIEYARIRNGSFGMDFEASEPTQSKLKMKDVVLTNFKGALLHSVNCNITADNCEFSNSLDALVHLIGGSYSFTHCTLANYYYSSQQGGWGNSNNQTLVLSNLYFTEEGEKELFPIVQADFKNTLIWGLKPIRGSSGVVIDESKESTMSYYFLNCLLPNEGTNDADFVNCVWAKDPKFVKSDPGDPEDSRLNNYAYNFDLTEESPVRNVADISTAYLFPIDIKGVSRFLDEGPDIGAYEYVKTE